MTIDSVDLFYFSMPEVLDVGDGSQDMLLVRLTTDGGLVGWGECEAAPLVSIASLVCPMSHSACKPVGASVVGQRLDTPADVERIGGLVRANSLDLLQADHTLSGIDMAMWDLLGWELGEPVYRLLGYERAYPKTPYASRLFGDTPQQTLAGGRDDRRAGFRAVKFGWGPIGRGTLGDDADQFRAAREGLGDDGILLVDAGTVWAGDYAAAEARLDALEEVGATWLEEPFLSGELEEYRRLAGRAGGGLKLAGGEGCHNVHMARHMIDYAGIGYVQVDAGRIGGISAAKRVADHARARGVTYVNHTFTSHLALCASIQPYAGIEADVICEYPVTPRALAFEATREHLLPGPDGQVRLPDAPGLGLTPDVGALRKYLVDAEIKVGGRVLYRTPQL
ncbi:MAG: mandelate racemase/muconate lactonizing enzyme family protein [uncultured Phycisphaerae bacterium]|uniref:Mandelate racemase/muconate lactonizing enzyme family protein n=1 Tax=uncultured Phycisphaerae bacterium TaxID=904963 RepID=A0A6J4PCK4_9BACT|nr:MAG: mandelate racemase/muconate lactonizing enzyme family protein [uncultured Phycisphaerae bacterium]